MKLNGMLYHFPRAKFADNDIRTQVGHVLSEANEASRELAGCKDWLHRLSLEVMDVYHSAETALRILEEQHGIDINSLMLAVYMKNDARGYYEGGDAGDKERI